MFTFLVIIHSIACLMLVGIILMQTGRAGGLTESFAAAESMFGAKTNVVLVKGTTIAAVVFLITCLSLAFLSSQQNKSLMAGETDQAETNAAPYGQPVEEADDVLEGDEAEPAVKVLEDKVESTLKVIEKESQAAGEHAKQPVQVTQPAAPQDTKEPAK